ncbi:MAG: hypothetical protein AAFP90_23780, partial [Planctomycetota bacterium]
MSRAITAMIRLCKELAAIGDVVGNRIRTGYAGQVDQRPYILLWNVASNPAHDLQGETGIETDTVQLDIYADSYAAANRL